jgi:2,3-bisphosphoglycerate-independent phosphoglycerate mutase
MREITGVFALPDKPMEVNIPEGLHVTTMSRYNPEWTFPVAFPPASMDNVLAETLAKQSANQCHIAGTSLLDVKLQFNGQRLRSMLTSPFSLTAVLRSNSRARHDT